MPNSKKESFIAKGEILFRYCENGLESITLDREYYLQMHQNNAEFVDAFYEMNFEYSGSDLMSGKDFYESVDNGGIIDYDGMLVDVFVDGFHSNLGLAHNGLCQGRFLVDGEVWQELCKDHDIKVDWANK